MVSERLDRINNLGVVPGNLVYVNITATSTTTATALIQCEGTAVSKRQDSAMALKFDVRNRAAVRNGEPDGLAKAQNLGNPACSGSGITVEHVGHRARVTLRALHIDTTLAPAVASVTFRFGMIRLIIIGPLSQPTWLN
jgi:hypothetical protein